MIDGIEKTGANRRYNGSGKSVFGRRLLTLLKHARPFKAIHAARRPISVQKSRLTKDESGH